MLSISALCSACSLLGNFYIEVEVTLRLTVSRPICLGARRPSGTLYKLFFLLEISFRQLRICYSVAPSLTRGRVCTTVQLLPGLSRAVTLKSKSRRTHGRILLSHLYRFAVFISYVMITSLIIGCLRIPKDCRPNVDNIKKTPWSESASELYRLSDRRLSAKWLPTFADRGCHVVSVTDPYGRILGFLNKSLYFFFIK
jgi:hypothetical protein